MLLSLVRSDRFPQSYLVWQKNILDRALRSLVKLSLLKSGRTPKPLFVFQDTSIFEEYRPFRGYPSICVCDTFDGVTLIPLCFSFLCCKTSMKTVHISQGCHEE